MNAEKDKLASKVRRVLSEDSSTYAEFERISSADHYKSFKLSTAIGFFLWEHFNVRRVLKSMRKRIKLLGITESGQKELISAAKTEIVIARRIALLRTSQKLFHMWHIFHLPFAIAMFVIMVVHVIVTIIFGYKWIF